MPLPNFFIIGANKSGTTALHRALRQHPEIFMSHKKEPDFFGIPDPSDFKNITIQKTLSWYISLFKYAKDEKAIGEASPCYLWRKGAAKDIHTLCPDAKFVFIFRNPTERVYSHFLYNKTFNIESEYSNFAALLSKESSNPLNGKYLKCGFYALHLKRYLSFFSSHQVLPLLFEDLQENINNSCVRIFSFLNIDTGFIPTNTDIKYAKSGTPRNHLIHVLYRKFIKSQSIIKIKRPFKPLANLLIPENKRRKIHFSFRNKLIHKPTMSEESKKILISIYRNDVLELQKLIGRDLSAWLK